MVRSPSSVVYVMVLAFMCLLGTFSRSPSSVTSVLAFCKPLSSSVVQRLGRKWVHNQPGTIRLHNSNRKQDSSEVAAPIASVANSKVKLLKSLSVRKYRESMGLVLLEGYRQIISAIENGLAPNCILYDENTASKSPLWTELTTSIKKLAPNASQSMFPATDAVLNAVSNTEHSQGIVAAFAKPSNKALIQSIQKEIKRPNKAASVLLLDRPADPGNVGSLIRSAHGFGFDAVLVAEGTDIWAPKTVRYE
jgi:hypothetical protein